MRVRVRVRVKVDLVFGFFSFHLLEILSVGWSSSQVDFSVGYSCCEERSGDESGLIVVIKGLLVELAEF